MKELIDHRDQGAPVIKMVSRKELTDHQDPGDPGIEMESMRIRDAEDPGTGTTSTAADLIVCQDPSIFETQMTSMRIRPTDHRDPDDPETGTTAGMIERGDRPHHLRLQHQLDRHGKDDPDMDLLLSPTST